MKRQFKLVSICVVISFILFNNSVFAANLVKSELQKINPIGQLIETSYENKTLPYDIKITKDGGGTPLKKAIYVPTKYDLREQNKVTSVKNQGEIGTCWTFSSLASLESNILINENTSYDFSEINMATHQYIKDPNRGGNNIMAAAYLASWKGAVSEADDPYPSPATIENVIIKNGIAPIKHVQEISFIPDRTSYTDNQQIKEHIYTKGAVSSSIYMNTSYINSSTNGYYYNGLETINHAITIVGWDDNYSKDNFGGIKPVADGAFIVKNSYGTWFGDNGYFYVSYYDTTIGNDNAVFMNAQPANNYDKIYQYDMYEYNGYYSQDNNYFSNVFTVNNANGNSDNLKAIGFYTIKPNTNYEVYVESDYETYGFGRIMNNKVKNGFVEMPGYHTVTLESPIDIKNLKKFAVVVKIDTPMVLSSLVDNSNNLGNSYISFDGVNWQKQTSSVTCLKAFTKLGQILVEGDLDGDNMVTVKDVQIVSQRYNIKLGMENYDSSMDFNKDNIIDIYDMVNLSKKIK